MQTENDDAMQIEEQDRAWLAEHRSELWTAAQLGYTERGRGAVLVIFEEVGRNEIVVAYTDRPDWPTPGIAAQIAQYNLATEMVVVCLGRLDDPEAEAPPRAYRIQYLTPAA
jgi:hypothetical protein